MKRGIGYLFTTLLVTTLALLICLAVSDVAIGALPSSLKAYYQFEESIPVTTVSTASTATTASSLLIHDSVGTANGYSYGVRTASGKIGRSAVFDGNDYIKINSSSSLAVGRDYSITLWIKPNTTSASWQALFERGSSLSSRILVWLNGDEVTMGTNAYWTTTGVNLLPGKWYHIAAVHSGTTGTETIYVNGMKRAQLPSSRTAINTGDLFFGVDSSYGKRYYYRGLMDDVQLHSKALTQTEISAMTGGGCVENWVCSYWGKCVNGYTNRTCKDLSGCGSTAYRPATKKTCGCRENWLCTAWGTCTNGIQSRTCSDTNRCGTMTYKPVTYQNCGTCTENWQCGSWSTCSNNLQTRTCTDANRCGTAGNRPVTQQACGTCTENWQCGSWSTCSNNAQSRTCTDANRCGTTAQKPLTTQPCGAARTLYISPSGSDTTGDGTSSKPFKTLPKAEAIVNPGDTIFLKPGTYPVSAPIKITRAGTANAWITLKANGDALLDGTSMPLRDTNQQNTIIDLNGGWAGKDMYWIIDGVNFKAAKSSGVGLFKASHVTIKNIKSTYNRKWGIYTLCSNHVTIQNNELSYSTNEHGLYIAGSGTGNLVENNFAHHNSGNGLHFNGDAGDDCGGVVNDITIRNNVVYENGKPNPGCQGGKCGGGSGINMDGVVNSDIYNNLIYDNYQASMSLYSLDGVRAENNTIAHNTIYVGPDRGRMAINLNPHAVKNRIVNNIFIFERKSGPNASSPRAPFWYDGRYMTSQEKVDYNTYYGAEGPRYRFKDDWNGGFISFVDWQKRTGYDLHSTMLTSPAGVFVNIPVRNLRLEVGSPAMNSGTSAGITVDVSGKARPVGTRYDIGAYESG